MASGKTQWGRQTRPAQDTPRHSTPRPTMSSKPATSLVADSDASSELHPVYTWGYTKRVPSDLLAVLDELDGVVCDTRHNPNAAQAGWTRAELQVTFGERFVNCAHNATKQLARWLGAVATSKFARRAAVRVLHSLEYTIDNVVLNERKTILRQLAGLYLLQHAVYVDCTFGHKCY